MSDRVEECLGGLPSGTAWSLMWWGTATLLLALPALISWVFVWRGTHGPVAWWCWSNFYGCRVTFGTSLRVRRVHESSRLRIQGEIVGRMNLGLPGAPDSVTRLSSMQMRSAMNDLHAYLTEHNPQWVSTSWDHILEDPTGPR